MKIAAANWKLNLPPEGLENYFSALKIDVRTEVAICVPASHLSFVPLEFRGAQNVSQYEKGAYTGEISASIFSNLLVKYCLVGHSERREYFNENLAQIKIKYSELTKFGIKPIVCFGEKSNDAESFKGCLAEISNFVSSIEKLNPKNPNYLIAYEPIWAIGTGITPTCEEIENRLLQITEIANTKVLYGGSVSKENINALTNLKSLGGVLVGGASLDSSSFNEIVKSLAE